MVTSTPWIVVVDDEEPVRRAVLRVLQAAGMGGCAYASGAEFLHALDGRTPDCVILDLHMPGMTGFEVQASLAQSYPDMPVIVMTGNDSPESRVRAMQTHPVAYLQKPMRANLILDALKIAIRPGSVKLKQSATAAKVARRITVAPIPAAEKWEE